MLPKNKPRLHPSLCIFKYSAIGYSPIAFSRICEFLSLVAIIKLSSPYSDISPVFHFDPVFMFSGDLVKL